MTPIHAAERNFEPPTPAQALPGGDGGPTALRVAMVDGYKPGWPSRNRATLGRAISIPLGSEDWVKPRDGAATAGGFRLHFRLVKRSITA